jgi:hypothetical protein
MRVNVPTNSATARRRRSPSSTRGTVVGASDSGSEDVCYVGRVSESTPSDERYDVQCPHCGRSFEAELLAGAASRYQGFKCPHCRLFVPLERAEEQQLVERSE